MLLRFFRLSVTPIALMLALPGACWFHPCAPADSFENVVNFVYNHCAKGTMGNYHLLGPQTTIGLGSLVQNTNGNGYQEIEDLQAIAPTVYSSTVTESPSPMTCDLTEQRGLSSTLGVDALFHANEISAKVATNQVLNSNIKFGGVYVDVLQQTAAAEDAITDYLRAHPSGALYAMMQHGAVLTTSVLRITGLTATYSFKSALTNEDKVNIQQASTVNGGLTVSYTDDRTLVMTSSNTLRVAIDGTTMYSGPAPATLNGQTLTGLTAHSPPYLTAAKGNKGYSYRIYHGMYIVTGPSNLPRSLHITPLPKKKRT